MGRLTLREATLLDALDFAGSGPLLRKALPFQARRWPTWLVLLDQEPIVIATFHPQRARRGEFVMVTKKQAARVLPGLVRLAQLTLRRFAHDGILVLAHVRETDARACRMARLTGFRPGRFRDGSIWLFKEMKR